MLRTWFIVGALVVLAAWVVAMTLIEFGRWVGLDLAGYASILLVILVLAWVAVMLGGTAYRIARLFAKPS